MIVREFTRPARNVRDENDSTACCGFRVMWEVGHDEAGTKGEHVGKLEDDFGKKV